MVARFSRVSLLVFKDVKSLSHTHTHTGPSKAHVMSTVIHRDDKGPLASFSVAASSWENEVSARVCVHIGARQFARRNDVILLPFAV